jgi:hypothetical protein
LKPLARQSHAPKRDVAAWRDADEAGEASRIKRAMTISASRARIIAPPMRDAMTSSDIASSSARSVASHVAQCTTMTGGISSNSGFSAGWSKRTAQHAINVSAPSPPTVMRKVRSPILSRGKSANGRVGPFGACVIA